MKLDPDACYRALAAHDPRFDGVFFVGVSTTRIYCRCVCRAKTPGRDRCTFYTSAAAAEAAGYRPCLRCRPELAPGLAPVDSSARIAAAAAQRIEDDALADMSIDELAAEFGVSARHLRRVVESEYGVSPVQMAQTRRLLAAKTLMTDTNMTATEVAFASGFSSLRRFNALFQERYRMSPTALRKQRTKKPASTDIVRCTASYRPPFDWAAMLDFLGARGLVGVECVIDGAYARTARIGKQTGWLTVAPIEGKYALRIEMSASLAPALLPVVGRVKRLFDLAADPCRIAEHLGELAVLRPGLRSPGSFDGFEIAMRTILGQQVSVAAATTVAGRFVEAFGEPIETPYPALRLLTPTAERIAGVQAAEIAKLGIIGKRAETIIALATAIVEGRLRLEAGADVEKTIAQLMELPGVGAWTAQYLAMRTLAWPDAFPHGDLGIVKALGVANPQQALAAAEVWRPWRAYAAMHLWERLRKISSMKTASVGPIPA